MDFRLKVFKTVAEQLSFTKAAKLLFISQPAVTKHINQLEKQYGKPLFNRRGNAISLTSAGEILLDYANKIIKLYNQLELEFLESGKQLPKEMNIAASTTISQYILPALLSKLKAAFPETTINLTNLNSEQIEALVLAKKTDLGLAEGVSNNPNLHYEPFLKDEIVLTTRTANKLFKREEIELQELKALPLVIRERGSGTRNVIGDALAKKDISLQSLNIQMQLGSTESIKNYLLAADSFAFLSIHCISRELKTGSLRVVEVSGLNIDRTFQFVSQHGDYDRAAERLKHFFRSHYNLME